MRRQIFMLRQRNIGGLHILSGQSFLLVQIKTIKKLNKNVCHLQFTYLIRQRIGESVWAQLRYIQTHVGHDAPYCQPISWLHLRQKCYWIYNFLNQLFTMVIWTNKMLHAVVQST